MDIIFIFITILWLIEFLLFPSIYKSEKKTSSFSVILVSILTIVILTGAIHISGVVIIKSIALKILALALYALGLVLRYWSLILLGKNFSRQVDAKVDQELVSTGTYRFVRHPLYLGLFLLAVSVPLYTGNILVFIIGALIMFKAISNRIIEEEKRMTEVLGERYTIWSEERYKFIPFIY